MQIYSTDLWPKKYHAHFRCKYSSLTSTLFQTNYFWKRSKSWLINYPFFEDSKLKFCCFYGAKLAKLKYIAEQNGQSLATFHLGCYHQKVICTKIVSVGIRTWYHLDAHYSKSQIFVQTPDLIELPNRTENSFKHYVLSDLTLFLLVMMWCILQCICRIHKGQDRPKNPLLHKTRM